MRQGVPNFHQLKLDQTSTCDSLPFNISATASLVGVENLVEFLLGARLSMSQFESVGPLLNDSVFLLHSYAVHLTSKIESTGLHVSL